MVYKSFYFVVIDKLRHFGKIYKLSEMLWIMNLRLILYILVFALGFLSPYFITSISSLEKPFSLTLSGNLAPSQTISRENIDVYDDRIVIMIDNASLGRYASTGSMKPVLDENSKGIRIKPKSESEIAVGDIVTYNRNGELIIHRVIEKGKDSNGTYFVLKGDNNYSNDGKIRFSEIVYKTVGVLY